MELMEHPDISTMMRYGTLEKAKQRVKPGFLYGYVYEKYCDETEDCEEENYAEEENV